MTAYVHRLALAAGWIEASGSRAGSTVLRKLGAALQAVQCARMISVLNRLPDTCLHEAGLRRDDLPDHARRTIHGDAAVAPAVRHSPNSARMRSLSAPSAGTLA